MSERGERPSASKLASKRVSPGQLRAPRIAGVAGGVGTTTLAGALRGYDRGREFERGVDVLVCRSTGQSLQQAATMIAWLAANGRPRPVLAVTCDQPGPVRGTCKARLRMIEPQVAALVVLPYVGHWRELTEPLSECAVLSERSAAELPKPLRAYAEALAELAALVVRSGLLCYPTATVGAAPVSRTSTTGPIEMTGPTRVIEPAVPTLAGKPATARAGASGGVSVLDIPLAEVAAYGGTR